MSHIVTGNKTWVSHTTSESKQSPTPWRHTSPPIKKKLNFFPLGKSCAQYFGTEKRFAYGSLASRLTVNSNVYCQTLMKLHSVVQNRRCWLLIQDIPMIHDNGQCLPKPCYCNTTSPYNLRLGTFWSSAVHSRPRTNEYRLFKHQKYFLGGQWLITKTIWNKLLICCLLYTSRCV